MTDLTVLVSPIPLYPSRNEFSFGRPKQTLSRPIMVTLETEVDPQDADNDSASGPSYPFPHSRAGENARTCPRSAVVDPELLSPPVNTWKSRSSTRPSYRYQHRPTRSQSAPPDRRSIKEEQEELKRNSGDFLQDIVPDRRSTLAYRNNPGLGPGELLRPPPPLCTFLLSSLSLLYISYTRQPVRPTTFWRKTRRSGVTSASYSPSSHLIRRSTYIAAGLEFNRPVHDLSALCVESRIARVVCKATFEEAIL